ncbi:MAG: hypothetical protein HRU01_14225 [Myxococcales bacterium]|nr:hypothetical protein [Myxococcales bacterium]
MSRGFFASAVLFGIAVAVRALTWPTVLLAGRDVPTLPFGNDAYYHLRRIAYTLVNFPNVLGADRYINFPHGARPIWTPTFDAFVALLLAPFTGVGAEADLVAAERLAMWVPPILGGATVVVTHRVTLAFFGSRSALVAGAILCVLSGHVWYSQLGFLDHHVAIALVSTLLFGTAMLLLDRQSRERSTRFPAVGLGVALGTALWVWPGNLLSGVVVEGALIAMLLTRPTREQAIGFAWRVALVNGIAAAVVLPMLLRAVEAGAGWGRLSPVVASAFQPWFFGVLGIGFSGCAILWRLIGVARDAKGRVGSLVAVALALAAGSVAALPDLLVGAGDAWQWLARSESFQAQVFESMPLLSDRDGGFDLTTAAYRLSFFFYLYPLAAGWLVVRVRRDPHRAATFLLVAWSLVLFVATLAQRRFFNSFSVPLSMCMAICLCGIEDLVPPAWRASRRARTITRAGIAVGALVLLFPVFLTHRVPLENAVGALRGQPAAYSLPRARDARMLEVGHWIRTHTPETSGWLDARAVPEYGVLGPWSMGHVVEYAGRRPTVTNAFGDDIGRENFDLARRYFLAGEAEALRIAERLAVRYVVTSEDYAHLGGDPESHSTIVAFAMYDGTRRGAFPALQLRPRRPLIRHRLLFESLAVPNRPDAVGAFKVFEVVAGARIRGRARPGARVIARLGLRTNRGRSLVYENGASADGAGRWEIPVPYANRGQPGSTAVGDSYSILCEGEQRRVIVTEAAVQQGLAVVGPRLCGADEAGSATPRGPEAARRGVL